MPADEDLLFGKLAVGEGFCTQAQIDECVRIQSYDKSGTALGELLLFKGHLTSSQHAKVLELQKKNFQSVDPLAKKRKEAQLFGKLAVREGLLTEEEANDCLREQGREGETRTLGEIMVAKDYLSVDKVKELLSKQLKKVMACPACNLSFTVLTLSQGKKIDCPRCKGPLQDAKPSRELRTDAEFATQTIRTSHAHDRQVGESQVRHLRSCVPRAARLDRPPSLPFLQHELQSQVGDPRRGRDLFFASH